MANNFNKPDRENINTPKKVYISSDFGCRLCGSSKDRMSNVFHKPSRKKDLVKLIADTLGVTIWEDDKMSKLICRCCERKLMKFIEFREYVQDFQGRIKSNVSVKRCNIPAEQPNKKRMTTDTVNTIGTQSTITSTDTTKRELFIEETLPKLPALQSECSTSDINVVNKTILIQNVNCDMERHDMETLPIHPATAVNDNASTSVSSGLPLSPSQILLVHRALNAGYPTYIGQCMMSVKELKQSCEEILLKELDEQCKGLCARKNPSVLRNNNFEDMVNFDWLSLLDELQNRCPFLLKVFHTITAKKKTQAELAPCIGMAFAILMMQRNHELSLVQRINTLIMTEGNAKKQLYTRCQKVGFSLSHQSKINLLDEIGGHFADEAVEMVKKGCKMQGTGDNWDFRITAHDMRKEHQNKDMHYFASNLIFDRVPTPDHLSVAPKHDIKSLKNSAFLLSTVESKKLWENYKVIISRVLVEYLPAFSIFKNIVPTHIDHAHQDEMSKKSVIVPLPIQMKDEKNYADVVDILSAYENAIEDIYVKAGVIKEPDKEVIRSGSLKDNTTLSHSRPDQPGAHVTSEDSSDHMKGISVPFGGDQLTRVRFAGAKDLRAGAHTAKDRFDHCSPFKIELWHTKASFLQFVFDLLFNSCSVRESGTLKFFREKYARKNVTPQKVLDSYEGCEQFFLSVGKAYILEGALEFWGMSDIHSTPTKNTIPSNLHSRKQKKEYFNGVVESFVKSYVVYDPDNDKVQQDLPESSSGSSDEPDRVRYYSTCK